MTDTVDIILQTGDNENNLWDQKARGTTFIPFDEDSEEDFYVDGPLARAEFDLPGGPLLRFQAYRKAWDRCLGRIKEIIRRLQQPIVENITQTIQNAYVGSEDVVLPNSELLTLLVSCADRAYIHECLALVVRILQDDVDTMSQDEQITGTTPAAFFSRISEADCQNVTSLVKGLISGFIFQPIEGKVTKRIKPSSTLASYDMYVLRAWYQAVREHYESDVPALVVIVPDLHLIDPAHLSDFLEICSYHTSHIPLTFLLGSSDPNHLHAVLPRSALACLRLEKYILPRDVKTLEHVIKETFFSLDFAPSVMIGPVGLEVIFQEFKRHNSTLHALISTLQLLHMQHFYNPLAFIIDAEFDTILSSTPDNCAPEGWKPFFKLLRKHYILELVTTETPQDPSKWMSLTPQDILKNVFESRCAFHKRMTRVRFAIRVLDIILRFSRAHGLKVPETPFEKMASDALRGRLDSSACAFVRQLKLEEAEALLEELYHLVHNLPSPARAMEGQLRQKLVAAKNVITAEKLSAFSEFLTEHLGKILAKFDDIACLDVWWTGESSLPNSPLNPNPRISIVTSLLEPHEYLGWAVANAKKHKNLSLLPDTCILFRRYAESGKMINIYDWYQSFSVALEDLGHDEEKEDLLVDGATGAKRTKGEVTPKKRKRDDEKKRNEGEYAKEVQARFMRSMHELEFLGLLKHTGRKADHVLKTMLDIID